MKFYSFQKRWFIGKDILREYWDLNKIVSIQKDIVIFERTVET